MHILADANEYMFKQLVKMHPDMAEQYLSHIEETRWNNYLSEGEAVNIAKWVVNQDGVKGFHWSHDTFIAAVKQLGGVPEEKPYYNSYALCVAANMVYSDMAYSIAEDMGAKSPAEVPNEKMALSCYRKAVSLLKDKDANFRIRKYFKKKMYADYMPEQA